MEEDNNVFPELKDIETKLGRKVPESLIRSLVGGKRHDEREDSAHVTNCKRRHSSADLRRLESKMVFLKQEMVSASLSFFPVSELTVIASTLVL